MTQSSNDDFSADELETLRLLEQGNPDEDTRGAAKEDDDHPDQQAAAAVAREQVEKKVEMPAVAETTTEATTTDEPQGDRSALRAARRSERRALDAQRRAVEEQDRLKAEVEALKAAGGKTAATVDSTDADVLAALEVDFPDVAKALKATTARLDAVSEELRQARVAAPAATTQQEDDYVPPALPDNVQDAVDELPELLTWQNTKADLDKWNLAVQADNLLRASPKWAEKPMKERLAEAVRRVKAELDIPSPTTTTTTRRTTAADALAQAKRDAPVTLSDLRGGVAAGHTQALSRTDMERMDDDALLNALG